MGSRSWPVWNVIESCQYVGNKSYGVRDTGEVTVRVGTGPQCSEVLVRHYVTRRQIDDEIVFRFGYAIPGEPPVTVAEKRLNAKTRQWIDGTFPSDVAS